MGVLGVGPRCGTDNWVNTRPMVCYWQMYFKRCFISIEGVKESQSYVASQMKFLIEPRIKS